MDYLFVDFLEEPIFPESISNGATIVREYNTSTVTSNNGSEQRNRLFINALKRLSISGAQRTIDDEELSEDEYAITEFTNFFDAVGGDYSGFRVKVASDYVCSTSNGYCGDGFGTGKPQYQLQKKLGLGVAFTLKPIKKPNPEEPLKVVRSGVECAVGTNAGQVQIDYTTGLVTFTADRKLNILSIDLGVNALIHTSTAHNLVNDSYIYISGVSESVLNNKSYQINVIDSTSFRLTGITNFSVGTNGYISVFPQPSEPIRWSGEFHHPMRFDGYAPIYNNDGMIQIESISLKELRI